MNSRRSSAWISSISSGRIPASTSSGVRVRPLGFLAAFRFEDVFVFMPRAGVRRRLIPDPPAAWEAKKCHRFSTCSPPGGRHCIAAEIPAIPTRRVVPNAFKTSGVVEKLFASRRAGFYSRRGP
jgi:hypothetical protein